MSFSTQVIRKPGQTSNIFAVWIEDESTPGTGKTGLAYNTASLTAYYKRDVGTASVAITLADMTLGTFTSGGFKEIDATNLPGWYEFCPPDAALATGARQVLVELRGATDMLPASIVIDLGVPEAITTVALTESYAADGSAATLAQLLYMLFSAVGEFSISGTTITCKQVNGSTTAMTFTMDSATSPTSRTRAS